MPACRLQLLEISQYLEQYLWPHCEAGMAGPAAAEHLLSMLALVNQKFREQVPGWACFQQHNKSLFPAFFQAVLALKGGEAAARMRMHERVTYLSFCINAFQVGGGAGG